MVMTIVSLFARLPVIHVMNVVMTDPFGTRPLARQSGAVMGHLSQRTPHGEQQRKQHQQQDPESLHVASG